MQSGKEEGSHGLPFFFRVASFFDLHGKNQTMEQFHGTTIACVRRGGSVAMGGDGQVTLGNVVFKEL